MSRILKILESPTVPDESCEFPFLSSRVTPSPMQFPMRGSDPHSDLVIGITKSANVKQEHIPDVMPRLEQTVDLEQED